MPKVNGKHYPYTKEGIKAAKEAKKKKGYSKEAVSMARMMSQMK